MPRKCPKCQGMGLKASVTPISGWPEIQFTECVHCEGKGWLPDDSDKSYPGS